MPRVLHSCDRLGLTQRNTEGGQGMHSCDYCGDRIGVWEPAIFVYRETYATTQSASPDAAAEAAERYHRECHARLQPQQRPDSREAAA